MLDEHREDGSQEIEVLAGQEAERDGYEFPVVGIGASAGGLEALERLFRSLPSDTGMAFVIVQHLSPDFRSLMDELLARQTRMPIHRVEDGMAVAPDNVYLLPPRMEMIVSGGRLLLTDKDPERDLSLPIDHFFRSLAQDAGRRSAAIVLSGTGSDGSRGIRDVHEAGGLVIAQSEQTAQFDGMPKSAVDTGIVDHVLAPEDIPAALATFAAVRRLPAAEAEPAADGGVDVIFKLLRDEYGIDFSYYKPNTVARRIERRLSLSHTDDLAMYVERLRNDPNELNSLYRDLLIGVTRFFRDKEAFDRLERDVLPELVTQKKSNEGLRIWVAGCATGEEAYSLAILIDERIRLAGRSIPLKIFASDVHPTSLEIASAGVYDEAALSDVEPARLNRYFVKKTDGYHVTNELRQLIVFARHDLIKDAPFTRLDLITCRNLLIYFQPAVQKKVLSLFHFGLRTGGVLFLGPSESPGELANEFQDIDPHWKLYRKRRDVRLPPDMRLPLSTTGLQSRLGAMPSGSTGIEPSLISAYDRLLEKHIPSGVLINERRQLVHSFGDAGRWLRVRSGRSTTDLLDLVPEELKMPVAGAIQRALKERSPVAFSGVTVRSEGGEEQVQVSAEAFFNRQANPTHVFVSFEGVETSVTPTVRTAPPLTDDASRDLVQSLELELHQTRENLQAAIEELETSNEEMQASNEELVASNEELQSTNEELHSVNEELYTVNAEYQKKIAELTELTDDMDNLLRSTDIGTIFLDRNLCIRKFTPQIAQAFDLLPHDVGRRIDSFTHNIRYADLITDLAGVLTTGVPIEKEVRDRHGKWFFLRMLPYRSHSQLAGVVLSLIDVSPLRRSEARLEQLSAIVESSEDAIIGARVGGEIVTWNHAAERLYGYTADEAIGKPLSMLELPGERAKSRPVASTWLEEAASDKSSGGHVDVVHRRKDGTEIDVSLAYSRTRNSEGEIIGISIISRDITTRKRSEDENRRYAGQLETVNEQLRESVEQRKEAEEQARSEVRRRDRFLAMLSHELRNPLAAIVNSAHLLAAPEADDGTRRLAASAISRQSQQMARLLDDLLDVARVARNKIEIRKRTVDLRETAREAVDVARGVAEARNLDFTATIPDEPLWIDGDPARLQQVQVNLLMNAIKYTPAGGRVALLITREHGTAVIRCTDNGIGIPPAMQERIFDLFFQLDEAIGQSDGGMGVGLTLVRALVQLHHGEISVHSAGTGCGAEFTVRLPLADHAAGVGIDGTSSASLFGRRILLVEDQPDIRTTTARLLESCGATVRTAADGVTALAEIEAFDPQVALIDIGLPNMNGYEVVRRVRRLPGSEHRLLVALTGFGQSDDRHKALAAGFDAHLLKPIDLNTFTVLVDDFVRRDGSAVREGVPIG